MALTLDATLATAQDSISRHPLVEIISAQRTADIPFDGQLLRDPAVYDRDPFVIQHSSGRLVVVSIYDSGFYFCYTDEGRTEFTTVQIPKLGAEGTYYGVSVVELANGNIGVVYISYSSTYSLNYRIFQINGTPVSAGVISTWSVGELDSHVWVIDNSGTFLLVYTKGATPVTPTSSGTYTGTTSSTYTVTVTLDGSQTTAKFTWRKGNGAESAEITATGSAQLLDEGVSITFNTGSYYAGQVFNIVVSPASAAQGSIWITSLPVDGDTVTIGSITYTFRDELAYGGGSPYEVKIDPLSMDITLENLRCAIMLSTFEGV